jgi:hypothetical protein
VYGVTSWGDEACALNNKPGVYAKVGPHREWIDSIIKRKRTAAAITTTPGFYLLVSFLSVAVQTAFVEFFSSSSTVSLQEIKISSQYYNLCDQINQCRWFNFCCV